MLTAVSSCSETRDYIEEKYTGERRGDMVGGGRRPPKLNPGGPRGMPEMQTAPIIVPAAKAPSAYDQYDADGNDTSRKNYIKEWVGGGDAPQEPRKAFKGKRAVAVEEAAPAPIKTTIPLKPAEPPAAVISTAPPTPAEAPVVAPAAPAAKTVLVPVSPRIQIEEPATTPEENGVMIPLPEERSDIAPPQPLAQLQPAAGSAPTDPHLSSVPKAPEAFKAIKDEKDAAQKGLEDDHKKAMEEKEKLEEEPTELKPVTLPQVEGMLNDLKIALYGNIPIIQAAK